VKDLQQASPTVTALRAPASIKVDQLREEMRRRFGVEIAGGQGELEGQIFRFGHLGAVTESALLAGIEALELSLQTLGYPVERGRAVAAGKEAIRTGLRPAAGGRK